MRNPFSRKRFAAREELRLADEWTVQQGEYDGRPVIARFLSSARDLCGHPEFPYQVGIAVPFNHSEWSGLPSGEDTAGLRNIEDRIVELFTPANESLLVGVLTTGGMREFVLYTSNPLEVERKFEQLQESVQSHIVQLMIQPDRDWQTYKQFFCP